METRRRGYRWQNRLDRPKRFRKRNICLLRKVLAIKDTLLQNCGALSSPTIPSPAPAFSELGVGIAEHCLAVPLPPPCVMICEHFRTPLGSPGCSLCRKRNRAAERLAGANGVRVPYVPTGLARFGSFKTAADHCQPKMRRSVAERPACVLAQVWPARAIRQLGTGYRHNSPSASNSFGPLIPCKGPAVSFRGSADDRQPVALGKQEQFREVSV